MVFSLGLNQDFRRSSLGIIAAVWFSGQSSIGEDTKQIAPVLPTQERIHHIHNPVKTIPQLEQDLKKSLLRIITERSIVFLEEFNQQLVLLEKLNTDPNYIAALKKKIKKEDCISITEFTNDLKKLTEQINKQVNSDELLTIIDNFAILCKKDALRKCSDFCLKLPTESYNSNFDKAYSEFQTAISKRLIKELGPLTDYNKLNLEDLDKAEKIISQLNKLSTLIWKDLLPNLYATKKLRQDDSQKKYNALNEIPDLEAFLQQGVLPAMQSANMDLDGNAENIEKFTKYTKLIFSMKDMINIHESYYANFFGKTNEQLNKAFMEILLKTDKVSQKQALTNLERIVKPITFLERNFYKNDSIEGLNKFLEYAIKPEAEVDRIYYEILTNQLDSNDIKINPLFISKARKDLADLITGKADKSTKEHLKNFLAYYLITSLRYSEFDDLYSFSETTDLTSTARQQLPKDPLFPIIKDFIELIKNPSILSKLKKHPNTLIAEAFTFSNPNLGKTPLEKRFSLNNQYLNALDFFEAVFSKAQLIAKEPQRFQCIDFSNEQRIQGLIRRRDIPENTLDKLGKLYSRFGNELAIKFSQPYETTEFTTNIDPYIIGKAYGYYIEHQNFIAESPAPNYESCENKSANLAYPILLVKPRLHHIAEFFPLDINKHFCPIEDLNPYYPSSIDLDLNISSLSKPEQVFIIGALSVPHYFETATFDPKRLLGKRYQQIIQNRYPSFRHKSLLEPEVKDYFIKLAISLSEI